MYSFNDILKRGKMLAKGKIFILRNLLNENETKSNLRDQNNYIQIKLTNYEVNK